MGITIYFPDRGSLCRWLQQRAHLPSGYLVECFSEFEYGKREKSQLISNTAAYDSFLHSNTDGSGFLFGEGVYADFSMYESDVPKLSFTSRRLWYPLKCRTVTEKILEHAEEFFRFFEGHSGLYGFACLADERDARNCYQHDYWGYGKPSVMLMVGVDIHRYVPGLYWMNYFSDEYRERHNVDVEGIARTFGREVKRLARGVLLQLYDDPADWERYDDDVKRILDSSPNFFSMSRVPRPGKITPAELTDFTLEISRKWP